MLDRPVANDPQRTAVRWSEPENVSSHLRLLTHIISYDKGRLRGRGREKSVAYYLFVFLPVGRGRKEGRKGLISIGQT